MKVWWNGNVCEEEEAVISLTDHGFLYGMGLFETFRTYGGKPFLLERHIDRLRAGCAELRIAYEPDPSELLEAISLLLSANGLDDATVRWFVSAGPGPLGLPGAAGYSKPNVAIIVKPLPDGTPEPKELHLLSLPRSTPEGRARRKTFHYMNNILAKWELADRTASTRAEGLFVTEAGIAVEGIVSNVFWVKDGTLFTPSADTGCLPGVTRIAVLALAERNGIPLREGRFPWTELVQADELFVTNSVQELTPVGRFLDDRDELRREWKGPCPVTMKLHRAYTHLTGGGMRKE